MKKWNIESWINDSKLNKIEYIEYWNNEEKEKSKEWYILDGDFSRMEEHLQRIGLPNDLKRCVELLANNLNYELRGVGIDLAAGTLWAVPHLFKLGRIERLYCLECSKHRLLKIGPKVLEHYNVPKDKVTLVFGDFYDLHIKDNSLDFILLSSAFHHAGEPFKLLSEIQRVIKPKGIVIIIGEHAINCFKLYLNNTIKFFLSIFIPQKIQKEIFGRAFEVKTLFPRLQKLLPCDPISGDHYYTIFDYRTMFKKCGFKMRHLKGRSSQYQSFILMHKNNSSFSSRCTS